jgi:hypothetical protein
MITLQTALCSNISSGNTISVAFTVMINVLHETRNSINLFAFVNDTAGLYTERHYSVGYDVEVGVEISDYGLSDDRGDAGATLFFTGNASYTGSNLILNPDMYDLWVLNDQGLAYADRTALDEAVGSLFNITDISTPTTVGEYTYTVGAKVDGDDGTGPWYYDIYTDTYIVDQIVVTFSTSIPTPSSEETVTIIPHITYAFDGVAVTNYDMIITRDGIPWKSFDETNVSVGFSDTASGETHVYDVLSITDNTYDITNFTSTESSITWYARQVDGGGDVTTPPDDIPGWLDWIALPDAGEDPGFYFIAFSVLAVIFIGIYVYVYHFEERMPIGGQLSFTNLSGRITKEFKKIKKGLSFGKGKRKK